MAIFVGPVLTHGNGGTGDDTVPPGISGFDWCCCVSDTSELDLSTFITVNVLTIGALATDVRTPALGSIQTYIGLDATQRAAAIAAGASPLPAFRIIMKSFDHAATSPPYWEP